jgi:hypothetical protein
MYNGLYSQEEVNTVNDKDLPETPVNISDTPEQEDTGIYITTAQARLLFAKGNKEEVKTAISAFGYDSTKLILKKDFDAILKLLAGEISVDDIIIETSLDDDSAMDSAAESESDNNAE